MGIKHYIAKKREHLLWLGKEIVKYRVCYLFLAPFAIVFGLFFIAPMVVSVFFSFTYFNILEQPVFIGLRNYINLLLADDVFLIAVRNTFVLAAVTGLILILLRKIGRKDTMPLAPFLFAGILITFFTS